MAAAGRSGSVAGSMAGGLMLSWHLDNQMIFLLPTIPALLAALALLAMAYLVRSSKADRQPEPVANYQERKVA